MNRTFLGVLAMLAVLTGCENDAASLQFDDRDDSISLVREQRWFWSGEVEQTLIPARTQECQRRFPIKSGAAEFVKMEIYEAGPMLYLANQGKDWYVIGTEKCLVQPFTETVPSPPGRALGKFVRKEGRLVFEKPAP
jgi:hypothetical protein